jgi:hypothetical protein
MRFTKNLLRVVALVCGLTASSMALAVNDYDGAWVVDELPGHYFMMRENNGALLFVHLGNEWEVFIGPLVGQTATFSNLMADVDLQGSLQFTSETTATVHISACSPRTAQASCALPAGSTAVARKIF